jgi:hypothetical protein
MSAKDQRLTKQSERAAMLVLLREREGRTPGRANPHWVHCFWRQRIMGNEEIKRMLGVGMATMSDHLRLYKDPFEPSGEEVRRVPFEMGAHIFLRTTDAESKATLDGDAEAGMPSDCSEA